MIKQFFFLTVALMFSFYTVNAQTELSSFTQSGKGVATTFATDYQALGINPANLGWDWEFEKKRVAMGTNEVAFSLTSQALSKQELRSSFWDMVKNLDPGTFSYEEKQIAAESFSSSATLLDFDAGLFGIAFTGKKFGGIAFRINEKAHIETQLGEPLSDLLFMGYTAPYFDSLTIFDGIDTSIIPNDPSLIAGLDSADILNGFVIPLDASSLTDLLIGTKMSISWTREYNLSYGRRVLGIDSVFHLYAGAGVKLIQGTAVLDVREGENGEMEAFTAFSPFFNFDFGAEALTNPTAITENKGWIPDPVGLGFGVDLGVNAVLFNKLKVGVAVNNIGKMNWKGNVYTLSDTILLSMESAGFDNYNMVDQASDFAGPDGLLNWKGAQEKEIALPTTFRAGVSFRFAPWLELGGDLVIPTTDVPGSLAGAIYAFGGEVRPAKWLKLSAGVLGGGVYDLNIPMGITIVGKNGTYEMGLASRDALTFFTQNGPTLSAAFGFMRFRI